MAGIMEPIPGIAFDFGGGKTLTLAPLTLGALERLQEGMAALSSETSTLSPASVKTIIDLTHSSLQRNYPATTREEVAELIDVGNMFDVLSTVLDVSGIKRKQQADAKNQVAPPVQAPTGPGPSLTSVPTPAGLGATSATTATFPP